MKHIYKLIITLTVLLTIGLANPAKACNANFTHTNGCVGDTLWFYAMDQYAIYTWDFGDSTSQTNIDHDTVAYHVYTQPGTYYVTLFVNIGAEWDYQTQAITIGADCFYADFTFLCGGSNYEYFYNQSSGSESYLWNFGDPASGGNNISTQSDPYHLYTAPGTYTVTLIAYSDTDADTISYNIVVGMECLGATLYPGIWNNCSGVAIPMSVYYTGNPVSYSWNFGDPLSGPNNTSTDSVPSHAFSGSGCYVVTLTISDGVNTFTTTEIFVIYDCRVWPGDANADGEVNMEDIFPLGMFYGKQGTVRPSATTNFTGQASTDWPNFDDMMYLDKMVNAKMADATGDGTLNVNDLPAIITNYGQRHNNHNNRSGMNATPADPDMFVDVIPSASNAGSTVTATIYLGTLAKPVTYLYGYAFTLNYDPELIDPLTLTTNLNNNWLGNTNTELTIVNNDAVNGRLDVAVVKTDKVQPATGYGQIASVTFQLRPNVSGALNLTLSPSAKVLTTTMYPNATAGNTQIYKPVNLIGDVLQVNNPLGINTAEADGISIYPNPATDLVTINTPLATGAVVEFFAVDGRKLSQQKLTSTSTALDLSGYANGVYICRIVQGNQTIKTQKVVISR